VLFPHCVLLLTSLLLALFLFLVPGDETPTLTRLAFGVHHGFSVAVLGGRDFPPNSFFFDFCSRAGFVWCNLVPDAEILSFMETLVPSLSLDCLSVGKRVSVTPFARYRGVVERLVSWLLP